MLNAELIGETIQLPDSAMPRLLVSVDTEEQWQATPSRKGVTVAPAGTLAPFQAIMDRHRLRPLYLVDYPVLDDPSYARALQEIYGDGRCEIGTHTHAHVTPPLDEQVTPENTYLGNLPRTLEYAKLRTMTERIQSCFGFRPTIYRAGRYGVGSNTAQILEELGYEIDCSVVPHTDFSHNHGPDFRGLPDRPYRFGATRKMIEIPLTVGFTGALRKQLAGIYEDLNSPVCQRLHLPGILNRLKLLTRIRLTPEGVPLTELMWLTKTLLKDGHRVFGMSLHSCSLDVGGSPYVRTEVDRKEFLARIDRFCTFFIDEIGGKPSAYGELARELAMVDRNDTGPEKLQSVTI